MQKRILAVSLIATFAMLSACNDSSETTQPVTQPTATDAAEQAPPPASETGPSWSTTHLGDYVSVKLVADLSHLDADQKQMLGLLIEAADSMNAIWWKQSVDGIDSTTIARLSKASDRVRRVRSSTRPT